MNIIITSMNNGKLILCMVMGVLVECGAYLGRVCALRIVDTGKLFTTSHFETVTSLSPTLNFDPQTRIATYQELANQQEFPYPL